MFLVYHLVVSMALLAGYGSSADGLALGVSIIEALIAGGITIASAVLFKYRAEFYGDYKKAFKKDTMSQFHYWLLLGGRVLFALAIASLGSIKYAPFICMLVPIGSLVYLVVKRPYIHLYNNIRAVVNEAILVAILIIYGYCSAGADPTHQDTPLLSAFAFIVIALLLTCITMNAVFIGKYWWDNRNRPSELAKKENE